MLSYSIILFPRYALPVTVMLHLLAAIALARLLTGRPVRPVCAVHLGTTSAMLLLLALVCAAALDYTQQFAADSRYALNNWAAENLPLNARVFADGYAELHDYSLPFVHKRRDVDLRTGFILPQMGGCRITCAAAGLLRDLRLSYSRYFEPSAHPAPGNENSQRVRNRRFYQYLLKTQAPVWRSVPRTQHARLHQPRYLRLSTDPGDDARTAGLAHVLRPPGPSPHIPSPSTCYCR